MKRRSFITSAICSTLLANTAKVALARDCGILNGRIKNNARTMVGQRAGSKYDPTVFANMVFAKSGAKPMWIGPHGFPRYGREIGFSDLNPGDVLQFNGPAAFINNGNIYFGCKDLCTTIVLERFYNGKQPWSLLQVAYQYKVLGVKSIFLDAVDYTGNFAIMFRPQL